MSTIAPQISPLLQHYMQTYACTWPISIVVQAHKYILRGTPFAFVYNHIGKPHTLIADEDLQYPCKEGNAFHIHDESIHQAFHTVLCNPDLRGKETVMNGGYMHCFTCSMWMTASGTTLQRIPTVVEQELEARRAARGEGVVGEMKSSQGSCHAHDDSTNTTAAQMPNTTMQRPRADAISAPSSSTFNSSEMALSMYVSRLEGKVQHHKIVDPNIASLSPTSTERDSPTSTERESPSNTLPLLTTSSNPSLLDESFEHVATTPITNDADSKGKSKFGRVMRTFEPLVGSFRAGVREHEMVKEAMLDSSSEEEGFEEISLGEVEEAVHEDGDGEEEQWAFVDRRRLTIVEVMPL
ncbi:MAG: hypothetical protein M1836_005946 [Candelina mexicana]|nr:MAG: hypothetical protein M1836_005946 [Candelina mexicana]